MRGPVHLEHWGKWLEMRVESHAETRFSSALSFHTKNFGVYCIVT